MGLQEEALKFSVLPLTPLYFSPWRRSVDWKLDFSMATEQHVLGMRFAKEVRACCIVEMTLFLYPPMRLREAPLSLSLPPLLLQHGQTGLELLPQREKACKSADGCAFSCQWSCSF